MQHHLIDLILFQTDLLMITAARIQLYDLLQVELSGFKAQIKLVGVIGVILETEAIVNQQEFIGSVPIAVENLFTWLETLTISVNEAEVGLVIMLCRNIP
jgi:hypothetical protein